MPDEVLFEVRGESRPATITDITRRYRLQRIASERFELLRSTVHRYRIADRRSVPSVVRALQADARIAAAQPNFMFRLENEIPRGALSGSQYAVAKMNVPDAHRSATGRTIAVAVIDSGIDQTHPELAGSAAEGFDAVGGTAKPHAHGTGIASVIGARTQLTGVAPGAKLLAVRAFSGQSGRPGADGTSFHVLRGIEWAHQRAARVVNMSFSGPRDPLLGRMLRSGREKGIVFVAAAGNQGPRSGPLYPAADEHVIAVTASDGADRLYSVANRGAHICVTAPGVDVLVAAPSGAYVFSSGTSMAAAHVSGAIALLLETKPDLTPDAVRAILVRSAKDLGPPGIDDEFGAGLANALAMIAQLDTSPAATVTGMSSSEARNRPAAAPVEAAETTAAAVVGGEAGPQPQAMEAPAQ